MVIARHGGPGLVRRVGAHPYAVDGISMMSISMLGAAGARAGAGAAADSDQTIGTASVGCAALPK